MPYEMEFDGEEGGFDLLALGEYEAYINVAVEKGEADKRHLNLMFKIADGPAKGRTCFTNCSFKKEAVWKLKNVLVATGIVAKGYKGPVKWNNEDLIGKKVGIRIAHEEYDGAKRETVAAIFAPKGAIAAAPVAPVATGTPVAAGLKRL